VAEQFPDIDEVMPFDPGARKGGLDNGLTWYVEPNAEPQHRAELRLVVRAGSLHEDDDQLGLAHFVEHMAFNGTEHFEGNELISFLESLGSKFGAHLNAYTSFDRTVYILHVPTDDPDAFAQAFVVLRDWAGGLLFDAEEIEKERGVVLEEWRRSLGVGARTRDATIPWMYHGARHTERLPIGTEASLKGFDPDAARRFYADWYRPDLMAVIAVGDFDPDAVQAAIEESFSDLTNPKDERERVEYPIPAHEDTIYGVYADPEQPSTMAQVIVKRTMAYGQTRRDYRQVLVTRVVESALRERLSDLMKRPDSGLLYAGTSSRRWSPTTVARMVYAVTPEGKVEAGLEAVLTEIERARRHGFSEGELARARARVLRNSETYWLERDKASSRSVIGELLRNFMDDETVPGTEAEWAMAQAYIPSITAQECNALASEWLAPPSRVVVALVPDHQGAVIPTIEQMRAVEARVASKEIATPVDEVLDQPFLATPPAAGTIVERTVLEEIGVEQWTLSNGVTVLLKPTDFKDDEVRFSSWMAGGTSGVADDTWHSARSAVSIARASGVGPYTAGQLEKLLAGKKLRVYPYAGVLHHGLSGSSSVADLGTALELVHAWAAAPQFSDDGFAVTQTRSRERAANRLMRPSTHGSDEFTRLLYDDHPRTRPWTVETYDQVDLDAARAFYAQAFEDFSELTMLFVGSFEPADLEPLVEQWIASLPAGDGGAAWTDEGKRPVHGVHEAVVRAGTEPKANVKFRISGDFESTPRSRHALSVLKDLLTMRLREELREDLGGVYSVRASTPSTWAPAGTYGIQIQFGCDPERVDELTAAMMAVLDEVVAAPPDAEHVTRIVETRIKAAEERLRTNSYWLSAIRSNRQRGDDASLLPLYWGLNEQITAEGIHESAERFIDLTRSVKVVLLPEEGVTEASTD
jgi:zinc protease